MENQGTPNQENINQQFNQQFAQQFGNTFGPRELPNSTAVLVLGIISIVACFCYFFLGIPSIILAIIALVMAGKANALYEQNPSLYKESSYKNLKAGRICAIIGLSVSVLYFICAVVLLCTVLSDAHFRGPWHLMP